MLSNRKTVRKREENVNTVFDLICKCRIWRKKEHHDKDKNGKMGLFGNADGDIYVKQNEYIDSNCTVVS